VVFGPFQDKKFRSVTKGVGATSTFINPAVFCT
jgi:hypothetical protein